MTIRTLLIGPAGLAVALSLTGCKLEDIPGKALNQTPDFLIGEVHYRAYDGVTNDLLTAGLGASGLASATAPTFADSLNPSPAELRRLAIYNNYRALVDTSPGGGYGSFFGPQVGGEGEGLIAGEEFLAFIDAGNDQAPVTVMVQIPHHFDPDQPCMVTAPSSGSRGVYGAIGTAGEWGLKKGCAVVYTDKGTGTGSFNLETGAAQRIDGSLSSDPEVDVQFRANLDEAGRAAFNAAYPNRVAFKHAHSGSNPEADWGQHVLASIEFGFYVLNEQFGQQTGHGQRVMTINPDNTLVIASSVSNGGGASVRAAEQDERGLIDGVAVSEPNVNPLPDSAITIRQGNGGVISAHSRSLLDYTTALAVYQGCANRAPAIRDDAPFNAVLNDISVNENICTALAAKGLVTGATLDEQATDALRILNEEFAVQPEQNLVAPSHFGVSVAQSIAMTYANAYGGFAVEDRLCGLSLAATDGSGAVMPLTDAQEAALFSASNGIPPTAGVNQVYDEASGGATNLKQAISNSSGLADFGLDALLCLRGLATGVDPLTDTALSGTAADQASAIAAGIAAIRSSGDLGGRPAVIVTGRADAILPINHTSRPYFGLNRKVEGADSGLRYYEVLNAHHLDAFNAFPGFNERYLPLHHYYIQALDLLWARLNDGTELPPSQVVRAVPRGAGAPALSEANLPLVAEEPAPEDRILFSDNQVRIPD